MIDTQLLPPNQYRLAIGARLGDPPSQRAVLELTVRLAEAGIEPVKEFKEAALHSLRAALSEGRLPRRRDARRKGTGGNEFQLAVAYSKAKLTGKKKPASVVSLDATGDERRLLPAITRARKRHGDLSKKPDLAKERALYELAMGDESGPDLKWVKEWGLYRAQLQNYWKTIGNDLPPESVALLKSLRFP